VQNFEYLLNLASPINPSWIIPNGGFTTATSMAIYFQAVENFSLTSFVSACNYRNISPVQSGHCYGHSLMS
jgi:hypothetical protein